ncbi:hypothetical protein FDECE_7802 [Fusarium decemcellulare]|nr:hypothetical protein FDECE_7802 [Fusarium decemcellulare]
MADPLSISASIAGLVTLADTIFRATFRFAKAAKNVKQDVTQLASETQDLAGVLHRLSLLASALELDTSQKTLRLHHVISCRQMLLRVEKTLSKATADLDSGKSIHHVKRALKWPFSSTETKELLDEIARHKETLTLALTADSMDVLLNCLSRQKKMEGQLDSMAADIKENLEIATNIQLNDQRQRVLDFFIVTKPQHSLRQCLRLRHPHTGLWLLDGEEFQQWLAMPNTRLWLSGIPGAGKTVLAGAVISEVLGLSSSTVGVAFFFCDYKDSQTHEAMNILQTMASQLARQNHEAYMILEAYYKEIQPNEGLSSGPSLWELNDIIHQMVASFEKVYMVVDGIDECGETAREVARALADIVEEQESTVSLTILSRDELPIREALQDAFVSIEIEAQKDDIRLYVATEMESRVQTGQLRLRNMALKDEILRALVNDNGGMFRWVSCQLDYLCELPRDKDRREALKSLPPTLNKTYERILDRIQSKNAAVQYLVEQCLHFIAVAEPPLTISELQEAVSIDDETPTLDSDSLVDEATIIEHCSSLVRRRVSYDGADTYLEFSHFSVAEYLQGASLCGTKLERYSICQNSAKRSLATACLRMLCVDEMSYQPTATMEDFTQVSERNWQHPFYPYAALLWPSYASNHWQDANISDLIIRLFSQNKPRIFFSWALHMFHFLMAPRDLSVREAINAVPEDQHTDEFIQFSSVILQKGFTPLHIAAALGLIEPCRMLVQKGADVNAMCQLGTPLHSAVSATNFFVRGTNASDFSDSDTSGSSIEDLSVSSIDSLPEPDDDSELDSISSVSEYGSDLWLLDHFKVFDYTRPQIIDLFIAGGAQLLNSPRLGQLPLFQAALVTSRRIKNLDMVTSLVKAGIVLEESDLRHFERFMRQAWRVPRNREGEETINRLISSLAFLKDEATTSAVAAQLYPLTFDLITSLAVKGSTSGKDSLLQAVGEATEDPLATAIVAVGYDNIEELKHILKHHNLDLGKRVNSKGETFLHIAVKHVSINSVKLMLEHGCNALVPDFQGVLPVWMCATDIHSLVLRLLIDSDQEQLEAKDIGGNTVWHMAANTGSCEILRVLIEKTPNFQRHLEALNFDGSSALNVAMNASRVDAAALLVRHHPYQVSSWTGEIPLMHLAARVGSSDLLKMLIDAGVDTKAKAADGSTPLHHLKINSTLQCVQLLKSLYPDLGARDSQGRRPLEAFVMNVTESYDSYLPHHGGEKSTFLTIFNELIPPDALTPVSNGPTFWADFWSKVGPNIHLYMFLHGTGQDLLNMIVSRLMQLGVVAAHEETTKTSAIPVFVSVLLDKDSLREFRLEGLAKILVKKLFDSTQYPDEAVNSYELVTLLHRCIAIDDYESTETFLKMRVDTKRKVEGYSALEVACSARYHTSVELLKLLFECADAPPLSDLNTEKGGLGLVHLLGEKKKYLDVYERTEASQAEPKLEFLITAGADPNLCTESGDSAVIFHLKNRRINTARLLVDLGADPTLPGSDGYDALTYAVLRGHLDFLVHVHNLERKKKLPNDIQWDKNVDITWDQRIRSWGKGMSWALDDLFVDGCFRGCNALHLAALQGHNQVLEFYLEEGLIKDIEGTAKAGWTAMHFGAYRGSVSVIKLLHSLGANVDACAMVEGQNDDPWTPYRVTIRKNGRAAKALLSLGARQVETTNKRESRFLGYESDTDSEGSRGISSDILEERDMTTQRQLPFLPHLVMSQEEDLPEQTTGYERWPFHYKASRLESDPTTPLWRFHKAISWGDTETCQRLLSEGCSVNDNMPCPQCTPLCHAVIHRKPEVGGNILTDFEDTPLHVALKAKNFEAVRLIIDHIQQEEATYRTLCAQLMTGNESSRLMPWFVNSLDKHGTPLLGLASHDFGIVKLLTEHGANVNMSDRYGASPLHMAVRSDNFEVVRYLLKHGADAEACNNIGKTPLMEAVKKSFFDIVRLLLQKADPFATSFFGNDVMMLSAQNLVHQNRQEDVDLFFYLLDLGLDPNRVNICGYAAMHSIFLAHTLRGLFHSRRLSVESTTPIEWNGLHPYLYWDLGNDKFHLLIRALGKGTVAYVLNLHPTGGRSPLYVAAWFGYVKAMENLISIGANIEFEGGTAGTALMAACKVGRIDAVKFLVRCGARLDYFSKTQGFRSACLAAKSHPRIIHWLLVGRHSDQLKITAPNPGEVCEGSTGGRCWSGPTRAGFPLVGRNARMNSESGEDWLCRLSDIRRSMYGKVANGADLFPILEPLIPVDGL